MKMVFTKILESFFYQPVGLFVRYNKYIGNAGDIWLVVFRVDSEVFE